MGDADVDSGAVVVGGDSEKEAKGGKGRKGKRRRRKGECKNLRVTIASTFECTNIDYGTA